MYYNLSELLIQLYFVLGRTALHYCAEYNNIEAVRPLLKAGVLVNKVDELRDTVLHLAAGKSRIEIIERIVDYYTTDREDRKEALSEL